MEKLILIIDKNKVYPYEAKDLKHFTNFYIKGERCFDIDRDNVVEAIDTLKNYLLRTLNYDDFMNVGFQLIYHDIELEVIKAISERFLPCGEWQIKAFHEILPFSLFKKGEIKLGEKVKIECFDRKYEVEITKEGFANIIKSKSECNLKIKLEDILYGLYSNNEIFITREKCQELEDEVTKKNTIIQEQQEIISKLLLEKEALKEQAEKARLNLKQMNDKLNKQLVVVSKQREVQERNINTKRRIVRVNFNDVISKAMLVTTGVASGVSSINLAQAIAPIGGGKKHIKWFVKDGETIRKNERIGEIISLLGTQNILAEADGRLFILVNDGERVINNSIIAVISDPSDKIEDITDWLKSLGEL